MIKVLFAHSDDKLVELYSKRLGRQFLFDSALDGLTALRKIKLTMPGLIVSDYDLPYLSGPALLRFLRSNVIYAPIPFIFFTNQQNAHQALSLGANDWLGLSGATPDLLAEKIYHHIKLNHYAQ